MAANVSEHSSIMPSHVDPSEPVRRDFLKLVTTAFAAIGTAAIAWTFIDSMQPAADVIAAGAPMDIDVSRIAAGQQIVVLWRGAPILIVNRVPKRVENIAGSKSRESPQRSGLRGPSAAAVC